jgi:hypothetical protein
MHYSLSDLSLVEAPLQSCDGSSIRVHRGNLVRKRSWIGLICNLAERDVDSIEESVYATDKRGEPTLRHVVVELSDYVRSENPVLKLGHTPVHSDLSAAIYASVPLNTSSNLIIQYYILMSWIRRWCVLSANAQLTFGCQRLTGARRT